MVERMDPLTDGKCCIFGCTEKGIHHKQQTISIGLVKWMGYCTHHWEQDRTKESKPKPIVCEHGSLKRQCLVCELQEELDAAKAENARLQNATYSLIASIFHSGPFDDYTGKQFRELLSRCGYVKGDLVFGKEHGE